MKAHIGKILSVCMAGIISASCVYSGTEGFSEEEKAIIHSTDSIMRVLTVNDSTDLAVLRAESTDLPAEALLGEDYRRLSELMIATVTHPSQDGVGIAAPQVGLNRRIVAVQRFDKKPVMKNGIMTYPFEVYPDIRIVWASDSLAIGHEGCLSVPDKSGEVLRSTSIVIEYIDPQKLRHRSILRSRRTQDSAIVRDTINGFTAVIFQHETDHLDGILYTDRICRQ